MFGVSEKNIYKMVERQGMPAVLYNERYYCNRSKLVEWAQAKGMPLHLENNNKLSELIEVIGEGDIFSDMQGNSKLEVLKNAIHLMRLPDEIDREFLYQMLILRENEGSTGFGKGIAIPHVRSPIIFQGSAAKLSIFYLAHPVDFDSVDRKPVHTLFLLITPSNQIHLQVISQLAKALYKAEFRNIIEKRSDKELILEYLTGDDLE